MEDLKKTVLHDLHAELGARMVGFAGYAMPVQYPAGTLAEHKACREGAALFDVSHMGQVRVRARSGDPMEAALALERLMPMDVRGLGQGRQRYGLFTNEDGGIRDDLMFARLGADFFLVVNAACKEEDIAHLQAHLEPGCEVEVQADRGLLALQGPGAEAVLTPLAPEVADMRFMDCRELSIGETAAIVARSGYTGEDGFEISVATGEAEALARALLGADAQPAGLGARDSLRVEAGLCLYGTDVDTETTPAQASLRWAIQKARRAGGERAGGFPGAERVLAELADGVAEVRVGLRPEGRAPVRGGTALFESEDAADPVGRVTSGVFGPTLGGPVAMGYVPQALSEPGTRLYAEVRGKRLPVSVAALPFITPGYKR